MRRLASILMLGGAVTCSGADFSVRVGNGVPRIVRDGVPVVPRLFECNPSNPQFWWKDRLSDGAIRREYAYAKEQGVEIVSLSGFELFWPGDDVEQRKRNIRLYVDTLRSIHPTAYVIPRLLLRTSETWNRLHPEARTTFSDGSCGGLPAYESSVFRRDLAKALTDTIRFVEETYGDCIAGYQIGGGQWAEWFYEGFGTDRAKWPGYDPATKAAFRRWLKRRYGDAPKFDAVEPPTAEQMGVRTKPLHSPKECPLEIDFIEFLNASAADVQLEVARTVRRLVGRRRLVLSFFCYLTTCMCDWNAGGCGRSGHLDLRRVMDSPDIDVFTSPIGYHDRRLGGVAYAQACAESLMKRGKLYLSEDDSPTHLAVLKHPTCPPLGNAQGWQAKDAEESRLLLRRNLATQYCSNFPVWWMDLHGSGWFDDASLWPEMARFRETERRLMANPRPFEPEMALAMDDVSRRFVFGRGTGFRLLFQSNVKMASQLGHTGAPYGHYLAEDILADLFPKVKFAVFSDSYALTGAQRRRMRAYAKTHGCAWLYAPGYVDLDTGDFSVSSISEATGFDVELLKGVGFGYRCDPEALRKIGVPPIERPCWQDDKQDLAFPDTAYVSPVPQKDDLVLARYANGCKPALVLRPNGSFPQLFCGSIGIPVAVLTAVARQAGVRMYASCGNVALANGDYLAVVSDRCGEPIHVYPPVPGRYRDVLTGRDLGEGERLIVRMKQGDTVVLERLSAQEGK